MNIVIYFFIALFLLPYLIIPLFIRGSQRFALFPRVRPAFEGFLPLEVVNYFNDCTNELLALGFEERIDVISLEYGPNLKVCMRLFVAPKKSALAIASVLLPDGEKTHLTKFLEFNSKTSEGHEISTHNSDLASAPIESRKKITQALPHVHEIRFLFEMHEKAIKANFANKTIILPEKDQELEYFVTSFKADLDEQCLLGCLVKDEIQNCYRPTWAGAFLMGWYSMWPINRIRSFIQRMRSKNRLRALKKA